MAAARRPPCVAAATNRSRRGRRAAALLVLAAHDRLVGLELDDLAVDGCTTRPCTAARYRARPTVALAGWAPQAAGRRLVRAVVASSSTSASNSTRS
jgi:hypothetical protein